MVAVGIAAENFVDGSGMLNYHWLGQYLVKERDGFVLSEKKTLAKPNTLRDQDDKKEKSLLSDREEKNNLVTLWTTCSMKNSVWKS